MGSQRVRHSWVTFTFFFFDMIRIAWASLIAQLVKNLLQCRRPQFNSWVRKIPWRRDRLPSPLKYSWASLVAQLVKRNCLQCGRPGFDPWVGKIPLEKEMQSTPVLLPGKSHGQRSLVGYSPWGRKELDTTERLHFHFPFPFISCCWKQEDHWLVLGNTLIKQKILLHCSLLEQIWIKE